MKTLALCALLLTACGGGGGSSSTTEDVINTLTSDTWGGTATDVNVLAVAVLEVLRPDGGDFYNLLAEIYLPDLELTSGILEVHVDDFQITLIREDAWFVHLTMTPDFAKLTGDDTSGVVYTFVQGLERAYTGETPADRLLLRDVLLADGWVGT